jgi:exodeoxyribonuclease-5
MSLNQRIRKYRGFSGVPQKGDRMISVKTNYDWGIFAGETGTLVGTDNRRRYEILFDGWNDTVVFTNGHLMQPKEDPYSQELRGKACVDFGYVTTCHKAQGSQYDNVIVWEEHRADPHWMYTAVTRAIKDVTVGGR